MLSVIIITKNEAGNLRQCLDSISWADEIIVLDSGSTDKTLDIAKEYTDKVYTNTDWQGYGIQKQRALAYATGDWVLNLDADEVASLELKKTITHLMVHKAHADACRIPIKMSFYGQILRFSSSPTRHIRLFKRQGAAYSEDAVHEKIMLPPNSRIEQLKAPIIHQSYRDLSEALEKLNRYSSSSASMRAKTSMPPSFGFVLCNTGWMFLRCYLLKGGFLDGKAGFFMAVFNATGTYYRGMKQIYKDES